MKFGFGRSDKGPYHISDISSFLQTPLGKASLSPEDEIKASKYMEQGQVCKAYLLLCQNHFIKQNRQRFIPKLWNAIMTKRYILPHYRQEDYYSQEACDYLILDFLGAFMKKVAMEKEMDEVLNTQFLSLVRALEVGRPTLFLEKEFAKPLLNTKLPSDYIVEDIKWRWPSFRVYLPKGLLSIERDGKPCSLMFLDIARIEQDVRYTLPPPLLRELITEMLPVPTTIAPEVAVNLSYVPQYSDKTGMGVSGCLDFDSPESTVAYAATIPLEQKTIRQITEIGQHHKLRSPLVSDELDLAFQDKIVQLALNILMYLGSYKLVEEDLAEEVLRKPKTVGERVMTGLYKAKFVGQSQMQLLGATKSGKTQQEKDIAAGRVVAPHWVSGHWQRIAHGPKSSLRKLMWIGIYGTGEYKSKQKPV